MWSREQLVELGQCGALGCLVNVGVDLLRGADVRVAKDDLSVTGGYIKILEQLR